MKSVLLFAGTAMLVTGCGFAVRSPEMYRDAAKAALDTKSNDIHACYDGVLKATPGVGGKVTVKFDVETEHGKFTNVTVDKATTTAPDAVSDCVTKNIAGLGVDPPDGNTGNATFEWDFAAPAPGTFAPKS